MSQTSAAILGGLTLLVFGQRRRAGPLFTFLAGLSAGTGAGFKLTFAPIVVALAVATIVVPRRQSWTSRLARGTLPYALGAALGSVPAAALALDVGSERLLFNNLAYHWHNEEWMRTHEPDRPFTPLGKLAYMAEYGVKGSGATLVAASILSLVTWKRRLRGRARDVAVIASLGLIAALISAFQPTPMHRDYLVMPVPWLVILMACFLDLRHRNNNQRLKFALAALAGISLVMGVGWSLRHLRHLAAPWECAPFRAHRVGGMLGSVLPGTPPSRALVATLSPIFPLEGGLRILPELATGPFLFRVGDLLTEGQRTRYVATSPRSIDGLLRRRPPDAILVGTEDDLEEPLTRFAEEHGFPLLPLPACDLRLYVRAPLAGSLGQRSAWPTHVICDRWVGADRVKLGDVNGDGLPDLVVPWEESGVVVVYLHPGMSSVALAWPSVVVGRVEDPEDAVLVDLDSDGALDVVSCCEGKTRTVFVHWAPREPPQFTDPQAWRVEAIPVTAGLQQWMFCEPAQIDGMHGVDLVIGGKGGNGQIGYLAAPENPRDLRPWTWHPLADVSWTMSIIPVDLNGNGYTDIVYSDRKGPGRGVYWLENPGAAVAAPWRRHVIAKLGTEVMFLDLVAGGNTIEGVAATDACTLLRLVPPGRVELPWVATAIDYPHGFGTAKGVRLGDLNGDGLIDVVFSCENADGRFGVGWLRRQEATGASLYSPAAIGDGRGKKFDLVQLVDIDGDGDLDVLTTEESGLGVVWCENPAATR